MSSDAFSFDVPVDVTYTLDGVEEQFSDVLTVGADTLDIDSIDPAYAPGTGTPEVGGFTSFQMLHLVRGLAGLNVIGADLVEVNPHYDHGAITSILAANLAFELLSVMGKNIKSS